MSYSWSLYVTSMLLWEFMVEWVGFGQLGNTRTRKIWPLWSLSNSFKSLILIWCSIFQLLPRQITHTDNPLSAINTIPIELRDSIKYKLIVVPSITAFCTCILIGLTWHFYQEFGKWFYAKACLFFFQDRKIINEIITVSIYKLIFLPFFYWIGWDMYRLLGADLKLRKALRLKYVFFTLQKFKVFFITGFCIQVVLFRYPDVNFQTVVVPVMWVSHTWSWIT